MQKNLNKNFLSIKNKNFFFLCRKTIQSLFFLKFKKKFFFSFFLEKKSTIIQNFIKKKIKFYSGKRLKKIKINCFNSKNKAGELCSTRKPFFFPIKKKKK